MSERKVIKHTLLSYRPLKNSWLVASLSISLVVLLSQIFWENYFGWQQILPASQTTVFQSHQYWRLFTCTFIHADARHLLANSFGVALLSFLLYGYFGKWVFPLLILALSALTHAIALTTYPVNTQLLGASGAVYLMAGFWLANYVFIDRRFSLGMRLIRSFGFTLILLFPTSYDPTVSYRTHGIGFLIGVVAAVIYFQSNKKWIRELELYEVELESDAAEDWNEQKPTTH